VPLFIRFGDDELVDREQLSTAEFWKRCSIVEELPSTAAPSPGRFEQAISKVVGEGATGVLVINLSGALSGTLQSAEVAVESMKAKVDVRVVDSRTVSMGLGAIVVACAEAARKGESLDAVEALAHDLSGRCKLWGALDTLENLKKGGRIGGAKALLGTVLSIKPIIEVREGVVQEGGKQRTRAGPGIQWLSVLHADCDDVQDFIDLLKVVYPGQIMVGEIGPVVGSHAGRGTIGVAFIEN
jgi:DegV family protein with EDD domain